MLHKMFKYRLYPTKEQTQRLEQTLERCCELYNAALQERRDAWKMCGVNIFFDMQSAQLPEIKEIREEYKDIYAQVLQDVLHRVRKAFDGFFRRLKAGQTPGYPRFRSCKRYDSFTYPQCVNSKGYSLVRFEENKVALPKIGHIKIKLHRPLEGKLKTCAIKREGKQWYAYFACEVESVRHLPYTDEAVGIDLGITHFAALSTGDFIDNPRYYRKAENKLKAAQQALSRKRRGANRRIKAVQRVAKAHRKVRKQRQDFLHKESRQLVNTYEVIVFEDIKPSTLSRAPKPKQDEQGNYLPNGASAKAGLNKSINDAGWSTFITLCQSKAEEAGTVQVIKVDPKYTSQVCSQCGAIKKKTLEERWHSCECGCELDRDVNAAINILNKWPGRGLQV